MAAPPRVTLLSLPVEALQRIFRLVACSYRSERWRRRRPPTRYLLLTKRLTPIVREIWHETLSFEHLAESERETRTAALCLQPPGTLDAIRDLHLVFSQHDKAVEYTVFAQCRNARSLYIGCADRGTPTFAVAPLQQLLAALRRLERLEFAEHVRQLANLRLPTFLRYLSLPVEAVEGARLDYLFVWEIKLSFCLKCSGSAAVPPLPRLPWDTLKSVELVFERDPTQELVLLAGQVR